MDRLFILLQRLLPRRALLRMLGRLARARGPRWLRRRVILAFIARYRVDFAESEPSCPEAYESFNASIHCAILGEQLCRYVADPALLGVLERILDASPSDGGVGIPIGNLTSQIFANLYLNDIDHWLTGEPACGAYLRYVDDLYLLGDSKAGLWRLRDQLARRLKALGLEIHPRKCTLQPTAQRVDILGYQVSPMKRWLRNDNGYRAQRRLKRLAARYRQGQVSRDTVRQSVASWLGHAHHADCDALLEQILAGVVFQRM